MYVFRKLNYHLEIQIRLIVKSIKCMMNKQEIEIT